MFKLNLKKAEEPETKLPTSTGSSKKEENFRKIEKSISSLLTMPKPLTVWITADCGKFWKRWEYQTTLLAAKETCIQVKKQQLEPDMEKLGKEYIKDVYCYPAYSIYMQSTSCKMPGWMKHNLGSRSPGEKSKTSHTPVAESEEELKSLLMNFSERGEKKLAWSSTFRKLKSWLLVPSHHGQ